VLTTVAHRKFAEECTHANAETRPAKTFRGSKSARSVKYRSAVDTVFWFRARESEQSVVARDRLDEAQ
jgi:hypothetical protein